MLLLVLLAAPACTTASPSTTAGIANMLPHPAGATVVNVTCDDGVWYPRNAAGDAVPVSVVDDESAQRATETTTALPLQEGAQATIVDSTTSEQVTVLCVPEDLPRLGGDWVGRWATLSLMPTVTWRETFRSVVTGSSGVNSGTDGAKGKFYQVVVDPNGVVRWFTTGKGLPAALEHDPSTNGLIGYDEGPGETPPGVPPSGAALLRYIEHPEASAPLRITTDDPELRLDGHDYAVTDSGSILALAYQIVEETPVDATRLFRSPDGCPSGGVAAYRYTLRTRVVEYDPSGVQVRIWRSEDHLPAVAGASARPAVFPASAGRAARCVVDIEHANAIDVTDQGDVVIGFRNATSSAVRIDWPTGEVRWTLGGDGPRALDVEGDRYGGPQAAHDAYVSTRGGVQSVHFFDNNSIRGQSRYVRYRIDEDRRRAVLTEEIALECHRSACYSLMMGSANVLDESGDAVEVLINPGSTLGEDLTVALDGVLVHYRNGAVVQEVDLGGWWAYRVAVLPGQPWAERPA